MSIFTPTVDDKISETEVLRNREFETKIFFLKLVSLISLSVSILYSLYSFLRSNTFIAFATLSLALLFAGIYVYVAKSKRIHLTAHLIVAAIAAVLICFFITGGPTGYDVFWYFIFPSIALFSLGLKRGIVASVALYAITLALSFFPVFPILNGTYSIEFKIMFLLTYIAAFFISNAYEQFRHQTRLRIVRALVEAQQSDKANRAKAEFITELSYQIRTPLSSIMGIATALRGTTLTDEQQEMVDAITTSSNNLVMVVNNIVTVSEIKVDPEADNIATFALNDVIEKSFDLFTDSNKRVDLKTNISISTFIPARLNGNSIKLTQILLNTYENIFSAAKKSSISIDVFVSEKKETVNAIELLFEIHTSSIKSDNIDFEAVYNYSSSDQDLTSLEVNRRQMKSKDEIVNFDLTIAKRHVEAFGGSLGIKQSDTNTTIVWFTLLLWKTTEASQLAQNAKASPQKSVLKDAAVLIVEDNLMNQKVISLALKDKVRHIELANNGKDAIRMFSSSKFDIILMDIQMPILDGYKTSAKIKELEVGTGIHTPIIALTANALQGDKEKCLSLGMDDYISKPFQVDKLLEKLEFHLQKSKSNSI